MSLTLMYITNDITVALIAQKYGVDRIWIDLETIGKEERQKNRNTVKSHHTIQDIEKIASVITESDVLVRVNPWNEASPHEINSVVDAGADIIMLPYWKTTEEVERFLDAVHGRCKTTLLLETKEADEHIDSILRLPGIDEIHIGLNDLHISYELDFMFELLTNGTVERLCGKFAASRLPYGFGGIASIGEGAVPAEQIILEHYRLGSTRAILSRSFCDYTKLPSYEEVDKVFASNMKKLREFENYAEKANMAVFQNNIAALRKSVENVKKEMKAKKSGE